MKPKVMFAESCLAEPPPARDREDVWIPTLVNLWKGKILRPRWGYKWHSVFCGVAPTHKAGFGKLKTQGGKMKPDGAPGWCSRKVEWRQESATTNRECNIQNNSGFTSWRYVTNRGKSKLMAEVWVTDSCFLPSHGLLRLEATGAEGCPWTAAVPKAVSEHWAKQRHTDRGRGDCERGESREQKVIPQETSSSSTHLLLLLCTRSASPSRPGSSSKPALKRHSDSSVQTNPNSTPLAEILLGIRSIKICILQLLQFALLLFRVLC